ncbi:cell wall-active antibiotics response protein LiaF [Virgibacillus halophilus]|uniref:Cell wall-active antibiotics response protein LiaF n=2 Tax=Tigheibacillus halophilus TaxID=361280 RepID=A0ABU5C9N4_9BACI|nr:cell wall-active antibiotics response protein LiaF [Virgibacillus halophilus]
MRKGLANYIIALILIGIGVMLVLENIGIATFNMKSAWLYLYPVLFIVIGLKMLIERMRFRGGSWMGGSFLIIFGTLLLLDRFNVIAFTFGDVFKLWPLLIVYVGFFFVRGNGLIIKYKQNDHHGKYYQNTTMHDENYGKGSFSMVGNFEYNQPNWKVEPMNLRSMAGDFYLDFSKAFIPEKKTPIRINSLAGDVHILVPENVAFRVEAYVKAGDIEVLGQTVDGIGRSMFF